ncbi:MAG: alpha/beta fold hydrolase [Desulfobacterales bacterium]|nr:alpha/beta fold hydrolase [Desulfobacterales bacterium]
MSDPESFRPPRLLRNAYVQTILASSRIRALGKNPMADVEQEMLFKTDNGARLQGFYSPQIKMKAKAVVILIHGWEGSSESTYILSTGRFLYNKGYAVFRLNFRDHGETHHLNEGLFYATLLDEVFESVEQAAQLEPDLPAFLVGFSMGGNFALRIARRCLNDNINNLLHVTAISPGLNPTTSTDAIDNDWLLKHYFLKKWCRSLKKKEQLYPDIYDFSEMWPLKTVREMTDWMVERYSDFISTAEYFRSYELTDGALKNIGVPTTMIIAEDDPIIDIEDFRRLELNGGTELIIHKHGGHNGFITGFSFSSWYEQKLVETFDKKTQLS